MSDSLALCKTLVVCYIVYFDSKVIYEENILDSDQHRHNHIPCNDSDINCQTVSTISKSKAHLIQPKTLIFVLHNYYIDCPSVPKTLKLTILFKHLVPTWFKIALK